jgi:hypothetical protein
VSVARRVMLAAAELDLFARVLGVPLPPDFEVRRNATGLTDADVAAWLLHRGLLVGDPPVAHDLVRTALTAFARAEVEIVVNASCDDVEVTAGFALHGGFGAGLVRVGEGLAEFSGFPAEALGAELAGVVPPAAHEGLAGSVPPAGPVVLPADALLGVPAALQRGDERLVTAVATTEGLAPAEVDFVARLERSMRGGLHACVLAGPTHPLVGAVGGSAVWLATPDGWLSLDPHEAPAADRRHRVELTPVGAPDLGGRLAAAVAVLVSTAGTG